MKLISGRFLQIAAVIFAAGAGPAFATVTTGNIGVLPSTTVLTGTLGSEADVQLEDFTLATSTSLTIFTTSYAGGTNLDGTVTAAGGFQPNVALFTPSGFAVAQTSGSFPGNAGDPSTGIVGDSYFMTGDLAAGSYVLSIANWATTGDPVSGFTDSGLGSFEDVGGNPRSGSYSIDIAQTPEPASFWLTLPAALGMLVMLHKRRGNVKN